VEDVKDEFADLDELQLEKKKTEMSENGLKNLEEAKEAINSVKKSHISELKALSSPTELVRRTLRGVLYILGDHSLKNLKQKELDGFWKKATAAMNNPDAFL